jgi:hypothetical protein
LHEFLEGALDNEVRWGAVRMQLKKLGDGASLANKIGPITNGVMCIFTMTQTNPESLCESGVIAPSNCNMAFVVIGVRRVYVKEISQCHNYRDFITRGSDGEAGDAFLCKGVFTK